MTVTTKAATETTPKKKQRLSSSKATKATMATPSAEKTTTKVAAATTSSLDLIINDVPTSVANKIDRSLIEKAVTALLKHHMEVTEKKILKTKKLPLLGVDENHHTTAALQVTFGLEVAPPQKKIKPIRIHIPHSIYQLSSSSSDGVVVVDGDHSIDEAEICFIVKDDTTKTFVIEMKEQFPQYMKNISMIITLESLRQKYTEFNKRRLLLSQYTHFIADDRILPMLTSTLGKDFIVAKKQPIPIKVTRKDVLPHLIKKAICNATYLFIPDGTCITIRAGYTSQPITHLVDNIISILQHVPTKILRQWANIRNVNIKLPTSIALPIYNQTPSELMDIAISTGVPNIWIEQSKKKDDETTTTTNSSGTKTITDVHINNTTTTTATATSIKSDVDGKKKKKKKSPLLKALEQQKSDCMTTIDEIKNNDSSKKNETVASAKTTKVAAKKKRKQDKANDDEKDTMGNTNKSHDDDDEKESSPSKKVKTLETTVHSTKSKTDAVITTTTTKKVDNKKLPFIAATKFQGQKHGYKYHVGKSGLGYYIDQPPQPTFTAFKTNRRSTVSPNKSKTTIHMNNNKKKQRRSR